MKSGSCSGHCALCRALRRGRPRLACAFAWMRCSSGNSWRTGRTRRQRRNEEGRFPWYSNGEGRRCGKSAHRIGERGSAERSSACPPGGALRPAARPARPGPARLPASGRCWAHIRRRAGSAGAGGFGQRCRSFSALPGNGGVAPSPPGSAAEPGSRRRGGLGGCRRRVR